ncbi:MAG: DUF5715 family protein [Longimicrobiales bacterium]
MPRISALLLAASLAATPGLVYAEIDVSLRGSRASMLRQNRIAKQEAYSFLRTAQQVHAYVDNGDLVLLDGNDDYDVIAGYPFARPVVRSFVERLSSRYHEACGERLVVTSLTRPSARQPRNASPLSVHPAGMAVDLRVSRDAACREWLSAELLELEAMELIDATLERRPPHYHIAVFPIQFGQYAAQMAAVEAAEAERTAQEAARQADLAAALMELTPRVVQLEPLRLLEGLASIVALLFLPITV